MAVGEAMAVLCPLRGMLQQYPHRVCWEGCSSGTHTVCDQRDAAAVLTLCVLGCSSNTHTVCAQRDAPVVPTLCVLGGMLQC